MSSTLFALLAIGAAGLLGAGFSREGKEQGMFAVIGAAGFVLLCAGIGYLAGISPATVMSTCGLALAAWFAVGVFRGK